MKTIRQYLLFFLTSAMIAYGVGLLEFDVAQAEQVSKKAPCQCDADLL